MHSVLAKYKNAGFLNISLAFLLIIASVVAALQSAAMVYADGSPGAWQVSQNSVPASLGGVSAVEYGGYAYIIGGNSSGSPVDTVYSAPLNADGSVGEWEELPEVLPEARTYAAAIVHEDILYLFGGNSEPGVAKNTIYYTTLGNDGTTGEWQTAIATTPSSMQGHSALVYGDYVYLIGGSNSDDSFDTVSYAALDGEGGIGAWTTSSHEIPEAISHTGATISDDGRIYVVGGSGAYSDSDAVHYTTINQDGSIGEWATSAHHLPEETRDTEAVYANGHIYLIGGDGESGYLKNVYFTKVFSDGSIGPWKAATASLPNLMASVKAFAYNGYLYSFTGTENYGESDFIDTNYVFYSALSVANIDGDIDGVDDDIENAAPNDGDGNNDGTPDSEQQNVTSFVNTVTNKYTTVEVSEDCELTDAFAAAESTVTKDAGYDYGSGLVNFSANCTASSTTVSVYQYGVGADGLTLRKHNPSAGSYFTIENATISSQTIGGQQVVVATYVIEDNGPLDLDPTVGQITDPVGLANSVVIAPNTGLGGKQI